MKFWRINCLSLVFSFIFCLAILPRIAEAASLRLTPEVGTLVVGGTFNLSVFVDTRNESVNAFEIFLRFPPDLLQVVSSGTGTSIVGVWASQPRYDNRTGLIELRGGVPGGITTSNGLVASFSFRAKALGSALIKIENNSKVLSNDGLGTDVLSAVGGAVFDIKLPPPLGPTVVSETHPDESKWYPVGDVVLRWASDEKVEGYSYVLSQDPLTVVDNISEGKQNSISYKDVSSGKNYFHIKSLRDNIWGGITHFGIKIDTEPPAPFPVKIIPRNKTIQRQPIVEFSTTDALSGIDYYELKVVSLSASNGDAGQEFFVEAQSPYVLNPLDFGKYDILVRAYDKAANLHESSTRIQISPSILRMVGGEGIEFRQRIIIPWSLLIFLGVILLIALSFIGFRMRSWHHDMHRQHLAKELPEDIKRQLEELKNYRKKYKGLAIILLLLASAIFSGTNRVSAANNLLFSPPVITSVSRNISNDEIFYIGGKANDTSDGILIYMQNSETGEVISEATSPDEKGDWFYRHNKFLSAGEYVIWAQAQKGEEVSPPSPQEKVLVQKTAIQFGSSRLSYASIYLGIITVMFLALLGLISYIVSHRLRGRKKQRIFLEGLRQAEESLRREFAVLERDIQSELGLLRKMKLSKDLEEEEKRKETEILKDLEMVSKYLSREIWEIESEKRHLDFN